MANIHVKLDTSLFDLMFLNVLLNIPHRKCWFPFYTKPLANILHFSMGRNEYKFTDGIIWNLLFIPMSEFIFFKVTQKM